MNPYKVAGAALLFGILVSATGCYVEPAYVQTGPAYAPAPAYAPEYAYATVDYPTTAYISTATPYYYGGRPTYFYNNRWYYQNGGRWAYYNREPVELGRYRTQYYSGRRYSPAGAHVYVHHR